MLILLLIGLLSFDVCCVDSDTTPCKKSQSDDAQQQATTTPSPQPTQSSSGLSDR